MLIFFKVSVNEAHHSARFIRCFMAMLEKFSVRHTFDTEILNTLHEGFQFYIAPFIFDPPMFIAPLKNGHLPFIAQAETLRK